MHASTPVRPTAARKSADTPTRQVKHPKSKGKYSPWRVVDDAPPSQAAESKVQLGACWTGPEACEDTGGDITAECNQQLAEGTETAG
jgi:hypothetical protein